MTVPSWNLRIYGFVKFIHCGFPQRHFCKRLIREKGNCVVEHCRPCHVMPNVANQRPRRGGRKPASKRSAAWAPDAPHLLPAAPIAGAATVVCDRKDADLITDDSVDDTEREASCDETTFTVAPYRAETWVLQEKADAVLELHEEGLR